MSVDESGQSQSCKFYWDDLGRRNSLMSMLYYLEAGLEIQCRINDGISNNSVIHRDMVVLVRRMKRPEYDDEYWEDDGIRRG